MVWQKLKQVLAIVVIFSICTGSQGEDTGYNLLDCGSPGKIYAVFFGCLIASSVIYKLLTHNGLDGERAGEQAPWGSTNKPLPESTRISGSQYWQSDIYYQQPVPVAVALQEDKLIASLSEDKNSTTEPTTSTSTTTTTTTTAAPIPYGKIIGGVIGGGVVLVGIPFHIFVGYRLYNRGRLQTGYSSVLYSSGEQRVSFQSSGQKVIRDAVPPKVKLIQKNTVMLDAGEGADDVMKGIREIRNIFEKARKPSFSEDALLRLDYKEGNYPASQGVRRKPSTNYEDSVSSSETGAVGGERRAEGKIKDHMLKEYKSGGYLNKKLSLSEARQRLSEIKFQRRLIFAEIDSYTYAGELTKSQLKEIHRLYQEQRVMEIMENKLYEEFSGLKKNQIPMEDVDDVFSDHTDDTTVRCKRSTLNCRNRKSRHGKAQIKTKIKREMGLSNTRILEKMDGVDVQEKYFLLKGKMTKKMGPVFSRPTFSRNQITKLRRLFPRVLSKVRSAAFRSTIVGMIPDVLIEGFFLGIDLSQDIPRWKSQSEVSADIMRQDDILKYVSKIWFWGMFFPTTEKRNALKEMDLLASQAYAQGAGGIDQSIMMLDAMLAMPERLELENSGKPIQRWEFPDGSVLYRVISEADPFQSRGQRAAPAQNENASFDDMNDFDSMMLGLTGQSVERFIITKKTKGSADEEIILASGSALSILMHELDVLMETHRKVQVTTEQMLEIYMDHVFETVDVDKEVSVLMSQYISSNYPMSIYWGREKYEKKVQDQKEKSRRILERQRDQKEEESRAVLAERLNRFSLMVEWIAAEVYRIIRVIDFMSEFGFKAESYGDETVSLLEESVRSQILSGADPEGLTNLVYPVSNSDEAELQKAVVRKLIEDTHTGLVNIASFFPSVRFLGLPPGVASCFRHECRKEGVNLDGSSSSNEKWCKENCYQDWKDTEKIIDNKCPEKNCISSALMKKYRAVECTSSGRAIVESEHNDSIKLLGLTTSTPDQLIKQQEVKGGPVSIVSYQEIINELLRDWLSGQTEQVIIDSMRVKAVTYWDMDSANPKVFGLTPVSLFALYCSISSRHPLEENKDQRNKDEWGQRLRQRFFELIVRDSHSLVNVPPVVMKGAAILEANLLPVVFGDHAELPFYQFEYFYQCPNGDLKRFDYLKDNEGSNLFHLDRHFEWDVDGHYPSLYKIERVNEEDVANHMESSKVRWTSIRNWKKVILSQFFFNYLDSLKSWMVFDKVEGEFELYSTLHGAEEVLSEFSITTGDVERHQKTVVLERNLTSKTDVFNEKSFLYIRNKSTGYVHKVEFDYMHYVSQIHVKGSLTPGRYMLKGSLLYGKGEKEMHFVVTAHDWFASTCKEEPAAQYTHHERHLLSEACAKDSRYEEYCRTLMGLSHHQDAENTVNEPLLLTRYQEVTPEEDIPLTFYKPEKLIPAEEVAAHHQESLSYMMNLFSGEPHKLSNNEYTFLLRNVTLLPESLKAPFITHFIEQVAVGPE